MHEEVKDHITKLSTHYHEEFALKWNPGSYIKIECTVGDIDIQSKSPTSSYYVIFKDTSPKNQSRDQFIRKDDGGWLHAGLEGKKTPLVDALKVYTTSELIDRDQVHLFEIMWSEDGMKVALLINHQFHAVYDFASYRAYCRTNITQGGNYKFKVNHRWSDAAIKYFLEDQGALIVPPEGPSTKDKQKLFIKTYLKPTLKKYGYQTDRQTWWKDNGDFYTVICLINSSYNYAGHISFWFDIGIALKEKLKDPTKKKVTRDDMLFDFGEKTYLSDTRRNPFRKYSRTELNENTDLAEFIREMTLDFEQGILPSLERLKTLHDWRAFLERFPPDNLGGFYSGKRLRNMMNDNPLHMIVKNAVKGGDITQLTNEPDDALRKELARQYFLLTGDNLPTVDPQSYGFSIFELLDHDRIDGKRMWAPSVRACIPTTNTTRVNLSGLRINNLHGLQYIQHRKLTELDLSFNQITTIEPELFKYFPTLQLLTMSFNKIATLDRRAFTGLPDLMWLDLRNNHVTVLDAHTFSELINLRSLILADNHILRISDEAFSGLCDMTMLYLNNNHLMDVAPGTFNRFTNLTTLGLMGNHFSEDSKKQISDELLGKNVQAYF